MQINSLNLTKDLMIMLKFLDFLLIKLYTKLKSREYLLQENTAKLFDINHYNLFRYIKNK